MEDEAEMEEEEDEEEEDQNATGEMESEIIEEICETLIAASVLVDLVPSRHDLRGSKEAEAANHAVHDQVRSSASGMHIPAHSSSGAVRYERTRILGIRALQISMNAPVMVRPAMVKAYW